MRIHQLSIYTSQLDRQVAFYSTVLELVCIERTENHASFQIGDSVLRFISRENATPYHFAINIPSNKEHEALDWLKKRVEILINPDTEIHDFDFWNAKAMYFYDPDRNIVEFISRRNLNNVTTSPFGSSQMLNISEIGMPTLDIESKFRHLNALNGLETFSGDFDRFLAIGDDHGLFICINKSIKNWFPTGDKAQSSNFELVFSNQEKKCHIRFENDEISELT